MMDYVRSQIDQSPLYAPYQIAAMTWPIVATTINPSISSQNMLSPFAVASCRPRSGSGEAVIAVSLQFLQDCRVRRCSEGNGSRTT